MLVCGNSGISAEELKSIKRALRPYGFICRLGAGGWLYFSNERLVMQEEWRVLLNIVSKEKGITPIYFQVKERRIGLEYGKECLEINIKKVLDGVVMKGLRGFVGFSLRQRVGFLRSIGERKV